MYSDGHCAVKVQKNLCLVLGLRYLNVQFTNNFENLINVVSVCLSFPDILPDLRLNDTLKPLREGLSPEHCDFVAILSATFFLSIDAKLAP